MPVSNAASGRGYFVTPVGKCAALCARNPVILERNDFGTVFNIVSV